MKTKPFLEVLTVLGLLTSRSSAALLLAFTALAGQSAFGALYYNDLQTDASGNFINPGTGWSGTTYATVGGVLGGVVGPAGGTGTTTDAVMIQSFTGTGVLSLGRATGWGTPILTPTTATMTVTLVGGSGDIQINQGGPGGDHPQQFEVKNLMGVTGMAVEFNWSEPLAAAVVGTSAPRSNQPFLSSFQRVGSVASDVTASYLGLRHTTDGTTFLGGLPGTADGLDGSASESAWGTGASHSWSETGSWQHIHGFDIDANGAIVDAIDNDMMLQEEEQVYGTGIIYNIVPTSGAFLDGSRFVFSHNGGQWEDTFAAAQALGPIPEPSRVALLGLGILALGLRRRR